MRLRWLGLMCVYLLLAVGGAVADSQWTLYIDNQRFDAVTGTNADTMKVDVKSLAHALGVSYSKSEDGQVVLNGRPLEGVTTTNGVDYASLKMVVALADLRMDVHSDLQMIDLRVKGVALSPDELRKEMLRAYKVTTYPQMEYLYKMVRDSLDHVVRLEITHPVDTHWVSIEDIRKLAGADGYGYSTAKVRGMDLVSLDLYVPFGLAPSTTLHSMAHELGHCWQYDHGIYQADPLKMEGFAEWTAFKVLESLTMPGEVQSMHTNTYPQYRDGLLYFQNLERTQGFKAVLDDMLSSKK